MDINIDKKCCENNFQPFLTQPEVDLDKLRQGYLKSIVNNGLDGATLNLVADKMVDATKKSIITNDSVTGYFVEQYLNPTLERAFMEYQTSGRNFLYTYISLFNYGGLKDYMRGSCAAEVHIKNTADIIKQAIANNNLDNTHMFQHFDARFSVLVPDASKASLEKALKEASDNLQQYAVENGLDNIYHPYAHKNTGIGLNYTVSEINQNSIEKMVKEVQDQTLAKETKVWKS